MIEVHEYQRSYYDVLTAMHESQNATIIHHISPDTLPKVGFIASDSATHIAIGFLRMVEGGYAQIDTLVTNADLPSSVRHEGLSMLIDKLIDTAKCLKLKGIISFTSDKSVLMRAEAIGFCVSPLSVIGLPLEEI